MGISLWYETHRNTIYAGTWWWSFLQRSVPDARLNISRYIQRYGRNWSLLHIESQQIISLSHFISVLPKMTLEPQYHHAFLIPFHSPVSRAKTNPATFPKRPFSHLSSLSVAHLSGLIYSIHMSTPDLTYGNYEVLSFRKASHVFENESGICGQSKRWRYRRKVDLLLSPILPCFARVWAIG